MQITWVLQCDLPKTKLHASFFALCDFILGVGRQPLSEPHCGMAPPHKHAATIRTRWPNSHSQAEAVYQWTSGPSLRAEGRPGMRETRTRMDRRILQGVHRGGILPIPPKPSHATGRVTCGRAVGCCYACRTVAPHGMCQRFNQRQSDQECNWTPARLKGTRPVALLRPRRSCPRCAARSGHSVHKSWWKSSLESKWLHFAT